MLGVLQAGAVQNGSDVWDSSLGRYQTAIDDDRLMNDTVTQEP